MHKRLILSSHTIDKKLFSKNYVHYFNSTFKNSDSSSPSSVLFQQLEVINSFYRSMQSREFEEMDTDSDIFESEPREKTLKELGFKGNHVNGWNNIVQPRKTSLLDLLYQMISNHENTNVQIRIGDSTFCCHMMVLQCYSEFFKDLTDQQLVILPIEKVTPQAFAMIYDWMITPEPFIPRQGILELFNAAEFLKINELIDQCWTCLYDGECVSEDAAFILYIEAKKYNNELIKDLMLNRIGRFFLPMVATKEFLELDGKEICTILEKNTIGVHTETEVFMAAVRWLCYDWPNRKKHTIELMNHIRFGLILPWQLLQFLTGPNPIEIERIVDHPKVTRMIDLGFAYVTTRYWYQESDKTVIGLEKFKLGTPKERLWIKEEKFMNDVKCPSEYCISYASFLTYLEMIKSKGPEYWKTFEYYELNPNLAVQKFSKEVNKAALVKDFIKVFMYQKSHFLLCEKDYMTFSLYDD